MAHYAFIKDGIVTEVIVGKDENDLDTLPDGFVDWEEYYLTKRSNLDACKRTSYNTVHNEHLLEGIPFRGNFAGVGYIYDEINDVFYQDKPFESWILDTNTWSYIAPVAYPDDDNNYSWNEETQSWDLLVIE